MAPWAARIKCFIKCFIEILRSREGQSCGEEARLQHKPLIEILDVGRQGPALLVSDEGKHAFARIARSLIERRSRLCATLLLRLMHRLVVRSLWFKERSEERRVGKEGRLWWGDC